MDHRSAFMALNLVPGLGSITITRLLEYFTTPQDILGASAGVLAQAAGMRRELAQAIAGITASDMFAAECERVARSGVTLISVWDEEYPALLKTIYDPPVVLYVYGDVRCWQRPTIAMVGMRRATLHGQRQAQQMARTLAQRGVCVVSGLARGIDTAAHQGAVGERGSTVAVLGSGHDHIYPQENKGLCEQIKRCGAVITEFPMGMAPLRQNFPRRNRIISGMARAVIVVEAARRSGSLITAQMALEQGREVLAMPGAANTLCGQGTNHLIKSGAALVENADDVCETLALSYEISDNDSGAGTAAALPETTPLRAQVARLLGTEPVHIDALVRESKLPFTEVYAALLELQLQGIVEEVGGKRFIKREG